MRVGLAHAQYNRLRRSRTWRCSSSNPRNLDQQTVDLHQKYHDETLNYVAQNLQWVESKGYQLDEALTPDQRMETWRLARERLRRWPQLEECDMHEVSFRRSPQRFVPECSDSEDRLGDPAGNVFVISLPRRPTRLRHALWELWA